MISSIVGNILRYEEKVSRKIVGLVGQERILILVSISAGWLLALGVRLIFPAILSNIRMEFGMSLSTAGLLLSVLWMAYAIMQFPGGVIADWFGERNVLVLSLTLAIVGVVGVIVTTNTESFFLATILIGLGIGLYGTTRITVIVDVFPHRSGTAIGVNQAAGNIGTTLLPPLAGLLAITIGWRWGFIVVLPLFILVLLGLWYSLPERTSTESDSNQGLSKEFLIYVKNSLFYSPLINITLTLAVTSFIYQAFTGFYPVYLVSQKGIGRGTAAIILGLFFATGIIIQPISGAVRDRFGSRISLVIIFSCLSVILTILPFLESLSSIVGITLLASIQLAIWPVSNSYIVDVAPSDIQGTVVGIARTFYLLFGSIGPICIGIAADFGFFDEAFFILSTIAIFGIVPAIALISPAPKQK